MKKKIILLAAVLASFISPAQADLIFLEDSGMVGERTSLMIAFQGPPNPAGKINMEVSFGVGLSAKGAKSEIKPIQDPQKLRSAMENLLKTLNDPKNVYINLGKAMEQAGWSK